MLGNTVISLGQFNKHSRREGTKTVDHIIADYFAIKESLSENLQCDPRFLLITFISV